MQRPGPNAYARGMSPLRRGPQTAARRAAARPPWSILLLSACVFAAGALPVIPGRYWWALAGAVMTLSLAWRQRYPLQTWAFVTTACTLLLLLPAPSEPAAGPAGLHQVSQALPGQGRPGVLVLPLLLLVAPLVALYRLTAGASRRRGRTALVLSAVALGAGLSRDIIGPDLAAGERFAGAEIILISLGALVVAWALGERARASREAVAALAGRAAALSSERAERERAAAADERARIAAELHDITAHHISVVALQAGAARMLAESGRPPDIELLRGVETASRQAMIEIRQALGVIRSSPGGPAPQPGVAQLAGLAARMDLAGLAVRLEGSAGELPGQVDLAAYRIVQEGLSNVLRHSAAGTARVAFRRQVGQLEVLVADDGPARERGSGPCGARPGGLAGLAETGGYGLAGLRERVQRLGGQLRADACPGGGFEVRATLPLPAADPAPSRDRQRPAVARAELPSVGMP
jgi:signal transduction histidine kinase